VPLDAGIESIAVVPEYIDPERVRTNCDDVSSPLLIGACHLRTPWMRQERLGAVSRSALPVI
jgi:hypothetical protein